MKTAALALLAAALPALVLASAVPRQDLPIFECNVEDYSVCCTGETSTQNSCQLADQVADVDVGVTAATCPANNGQATNGRCCNNFESDPETNFGFAGTGINCAQPVL